MVLKNYINKIINGDCLKIMDNIPDNSVDVSFADPPFNLKKKYNKYYDKKEVNDYLNWCQKWINEMVRITKPTGSIFVHNIPKWLTYFASYLNEVAEFKHWIAWDAPTAPMGKSLLPSLYGFLYYVKDNKENKFYEIRYPHKRCRKGGYLLKDYGGKKHTIHPFGPLVSDVWTDIHRIKHNKYRDDHPCQLPLHLLERIILMSSDQDDIIFDPFVGAGTTAVAAKRLGRNYIGIDIDESYVKITENKLSMESSVSNIEGIWFSYYLKDIITIRNKDWDELSKYFEIPENRKELDFTKIKLKKEQAKKLDKYLNSK